MMARSRLRPLCALVLPAFSLVGCFPPSAPEEATSCIDDGPAFDGKTALIVGTRSEQDDFVDLEDGASLAIDVGSQGAQHVYYSARVHTGGKELVVTAKFTRDDGVVYGRGSWIVEGCTEPWAELSDARLILDENLEMKGTLEVKVGACSPEGCALDAAGDYVFDEPVGEVSRDILIEAYI